MAKYADSPEVWEAVLKEIQNESAGVTSGWEKSLTQLIAWANAHLATQPARPDGTPQNAEKEGADVHRAMSILQGEIFKVHSLASEALETPEDRREAEENEWSLFRIRRISDEDPLHMQRCCKND